MSVCLVGNTDLRHRIVEPSNQGGRLDTRQPLRIKLLKSRDHLKVCLFYQKQAMEYELI